MPAPANDLCAAATVIASLPHAETGLDSTDATTTVGENSAWAGDGTIAGAAQLFRTMWWEYTPAIDERVHFELTTATTLAVAVYTGSCGALVEVASYKWKLTLDLIGGTTYKIAVGRFTDAGAAFDFSAAISTAPANQLQLTAKDLTGLLPFTASVDLSLATDVSSVNPAVYYRYTAGADERMVGIIAYSGVFDVAQTQFVPPADVFDANPAALVVEVVNLPIQYPLTPGQDVIFKIYRQFGATGTALIDFVEAPREDMPVGTLIDPDDTTGFPAAAISTATGEILRFVPLPPGEFGDILRNGTILLDGSASPDGVQLFNAQFALLLTLGTVGSAATTERPIRISAGLQEFFLGSAGGGGPMASIRRISSAGVVGTTWTLPDVGLVALAPNSVGSIVYVGGQSSSTNTPIKRWLTAGAGSFGTDLAAGLGANERVWDMLVLSDDSVIVSWLNTSTGTVTVKRFLDDGTVLGTLTKPGMATFFTRLAFDYLTYQTHFWMWSHTTDGFSVWEKVEASTMTVVYTVPDVREYESGTYTGGQTDTPDRRFGASQSCPFFFMRVAVEDADDIVIAAGTPGPYVWVHWPRRVG